MRALSILLLTVLCSSAPATGQTVDAVQSLDVRVGAYAASWNETDPEARRALLEQVWSEDGVYMDPSGRAEGRVALVEHIGGFQQQSPGATISISSEVDAYGDVFRFTWEIRDASGQLVAEGMDFGELAEDGRIRRITGFFTRMPRPLGAGAS